MKWVALKFSRRRKPIRKPIRRTTLILEELEDRRLFSTNITQYHVDSQSTGANLTETQLTPSNVNAADFGQLYNTPVDGHVYAEPLVLSNLAIKAGPNTVGTPGTYASVVFVATQHDSLYAIDAASGAILWHRTFLDTTNPNDYLPGATSVTTIPSSDTNSGDINPEIGITGTPVIDASTNIIYLDANTKEMVGGQAYYVQRLHAINASDGTDAAPAFIIGTTTGSGENTNNTPIYVNGSGDGNVNGVVQFNALRESNRPALSLVNGQVYAAWASHGDNGPYHGWVIRWDVTNLTTQGLFLSGVLNTDPNGGLGGIWGGGGGLTFDPSETVNGQPAFYFETGNGAPRGGDPPLDANGFPADSNYYESLVKVEADPTTTPTNQNSNGWGLKIVDYFTPYNVNALDDADEDFGSGSPLVLPDSAGIPGHPHLIVAAGKEGKIYLLDRDNLGKFHHNDDAVLNSVYDPNTGVTTPPVLINGSLSTPAFYHGELYWVSGYDSNAWSYLVAPNLAPNPPTVPVATIQPTSETANNDFGYLPGSVMISANGSEDPAGGIAWIMDLNNGELHAYSTLSLSTELWNSGPGSIAGVKFAVPTVANGQVFVGTQNSLQVFGITGPSIPAKAPNAPANLSAMALSGSAIELNWTDSTVSPNFATNYAIQESTDGVNFTTVANAGQESTSYTVTGLNLNTTYYFQVVGSNSAGSSGPSNIASATTTNQTGQTPTAPQGLGATPASGSEVYLTWTNTASNETGFVLTRATDSLFTQNVVTETLASAPYYYTDSVAGISPGNTYYYRLQASNSAGLSSTSNTASVNVPNVPSAPTNATAVPSNGNIVVSWTDHAGPFALGYQIDRSVDGGPFAIYADRPETSDSPPSTQTYIDTNAPSGHTYTYEIVAENISGFSAPAYATATPGIFSTLSVSGFPSPATAGVPQTFTVAALDAYGNPALNYTGTVHFTSSDPQAALPPDYTFTLNDQGRHSFTATLKTAGTQSITATDTSNSSVIASETGITVTSASAATLILSNTTSNTTAGTAFQVTLTAMDAYGNIATGYTGTVHFTSTDPKAGLPADYTFTSGDAGQHIFSITLKTAGTQSVTAKDIATGSLTATASNITVIPAATAVLSVTGPNGAVLAGTVAPFTVTAYDAYGNKTPGYTGTVHFTSSDPHAVLPADYTFTSGDQGTHPFIATLKTAGTESITATDTVTQSVTGTAAGITVTPGAAQTLVFGNLPSSITAGSPFTVTLMAIDVYGNVATDYSGTVHFTTTDPEPVLPADYTFNFGTPAQHTFSITLVTAGTQTLAAADTAANGFSATANNIVVNPAAASSLNISGLSNPVLAGNAYTITVRAVDIYGNTASNYLGTVHFTSSDPNAVLPGDYTFTAGDKSTHTFSNAITFGTVGTQTLSATDTASSRVEGTATVQVQVATPSIVSLSPNTAVAGSPNLALTITGTGFEPTSTVTFGTTTLKPSTVNSNTQLTVTIPAGLLAKQGNIAVTVNNPLGIGASGGALSSNSVIFTITRSPSSPPPPPPSATPTTATIVNVTNQYSGFVQLETVTVSVTNPNGAAVNEGVATIQVDGQTVYAAVQNGMATATIATGVLDTRLLMDVLGTHPLTVSYSDNKGTFATSSASTSLPPILLDFLFFELNQELALLEAVTRSQFVIG